MLRKYVSALFLFCKILLFLIITDISFSMAEQRQANFHLAKTGDRLTTDVISSHNVESMAECGQHCLGSETCVGINYRSANKHNKQNCQLTSKHSEAESEAEEYQQETNNTRDWTFYKALDIQSLHCSKISCDNGGKCVPNLGEPDGFSCKCGLKYRGKFCEIKKVFKSCKAVLDISSEAKDGIYKIKTNTTSGYTDAYCLMTSLPGCSGGGWTMVMKINGSKATFNHSSNYWNNTQSYNTSGGKTAFDDHETKLATYHSTSFKELCVGMKVANDLRFVSISYNASSLYSLIKDSTRFISTNLGRQKWKSLIANSSLQVNCNKEGFNVKMDQTRHARVRLGIVGNENNNCDSPDSFLGFGGEAFTPIYGQCTFTTPPRTTCGNVASCNADNGDADIKAMGYILVR